MATHEISPDDPYIGWRGRLPEPELAPGKSALVVIDMQYSCASPDHGTLKYRRENGFTNQLDYMTDRIKLIVPKIQQLQRAFRERGIEVVHARIRSLKKDGSDRSNAHKELSNHSPAGTKEAEILDELKPVDDELLFDKTTGSVFNSTTIDYVLKNMGIQNLVFVGMMTGGCVESSVRDAKDLGYRVIVVDDACGTWTHEMHEFALLVMNEVFAKVKTTDEVLAALPPLR